MPEHEHYYLAYRAQPTPTGLFAFDKEEGMLPLRVYSDDVDYVRLYGHTPSVSDTARGISHFCPCGEQGYPVPA